MGSHEAAELVKRYKERANLSQAFIAHELSQELGRRIDQTTVSKHLKGAAWTFDLLPAYARVLGIPNEEMAAAWGLDIGNRRAVRPVTLADLVKADPTLSKAAKKHLISQYELLQLASQQERKGNPVLPESRTSAQRRRSG